MMKLSKSEAVGFSSSVWKNSKLQNRVIILIYPKNAVEWTSNQTKLKIHEVHRVLISLSSRVALYMRWVWMINKTKLGLHLVFSLEYIYIYIFWISNFWPQGKGKEGSSDLRFMRRGPKLIVQPLGVKNGKVLYLNIKKPKWSPINLSPNHAQELRHLKS